MRKPLISPCRCHIIRKCPSEEWAPWCRHTWKWIQIYWQMRASARYSEETYLIHALLFSEEMSFRRVSALMYSLHRVIVKISSALQKSSWTMVKAGGREELRIRLHYEARCKQIQGNANQIFWHFKSNQTPRNSRSNQIKMSENYLQIKSTQIKICPEQINSFKKT